MAETRDTSSKHHAEIALIRRSLRLLGGCRTILDVPCRNGELSLLLWDEGFAVTGLDRRERAVATARELSAQAGARIAFQLGNLETMSFAERHFDAAMCFRFYHHLGDEPVRERVIAELCRVTSRFVLLGYLSPFSIPGLRCAVDQLLRTRRSVRHATTRNGLRARFARHGFKLVRDLSYSGWIRGFRIAVFQRR